MTKDQRTPRELDEDEVLNAINSGGELRPIHDGLYQILVVKLVTGGMTLANLAQKGYLARGHADKYVVTREGLAHLNEVANLGNEPLEQVHTNDTLPGSFHQ